MKKYFSILLLLLAVSLLINSCRKDFEPSVKEEFAQGETTWATIHYKKLIKEQGRLVGKVNRAPGFNVSSVEIKNYKHTIWKKAHYSENNKTSIVEIPILYNQRSSGAVSKAKLSEAESQEIYRASFDRLIIYKDKKTGKSSQKIVTYIPELHYLRKHKNDISHNLINELDKDYTGFLVFKKWDGTKLYILEVTNGKLTGRANYPPKSDGKKDKEFKVKTWYECGVTYTTKWEDVVTVELDPETHTYVNKIESMIVGYEEDPLMCNDNMTGDTCIDFGLYCEPFLTGDPCIDYGDCDAIPPPTYTPIIIKDPSITNHPKTNCILGSLETNNRAYDKLLSAFKNSTNYNVTFKRGDVIPTLPGHTANASTVVTPGSPNIDIYIRTGFVNDEIAWNVARAFIHEMAHAYIGQKLISIGGPGSLKGHLEDTEFKDLFDYYSQHVNPTTGLWSATANDDDAQHAAMAGLLIGDIAAGIEDFMKVNNSIIGENPIITFENYKAAAWIGLRGTEAYTKFKNENGETDYTQDQKHSALTSNTNPCITP